MGDKVGGGGGGEAYAKVVKKSLPTLLPDEEDDGGRTEAGDSAVSEVVWLGVPSKKPESALAEFWAKLGWDSGLASKDCVLCKSAGTGVEVATVSAAFGNLTDRFIHVFFCSACKNYFARRRQADADTPAPFLTRMESTTVDPPPKEPLWDTTGDFAAPSDEQLGDLFAGVKISEKPKEKVVSTAASSKGNVSKGKKSKGILIEFYEEHEAGADSHDHERALLEKYNKEAQELGEETFRAGESTAKRNESKDDSCNPDSFVAQLNLEPDQRVRYSYEGRPLIPFPEARAKVSAKRKCPTCGGAREFEFQLTPQSLLDINGQTGLNLDFSTLLVFTCKESCADGAIEEVMAVDSL